MEKPTTFKSVKTVFTFIKSHLSDIPKQFGKLVESFGKKQMLQPLLMKTIQNRKTLFVLSLILFFGSVNAQEGTAFSPRLTNGNVKVKGDIILIGNTVINKVNNRAYKGNKPPAGYDENPADFSPAKPVNGVRYTGDVTNIMDLKAEANKAFDGNGNNNDFYVEYSDVDNDPDTFNSTMANLTINNSCKNIVFAGLYWSAIYPYERSTNKDTKYDGSLREDDWNTVKLKLPNGAYELITASKTDKREVIFDGYKKNGPNVSDSFKDSPYVCFKDITKKLQDLPDASGDYYVANVRAARGKRNGGGAGGWTLVVIYESPSLPSKFISVFDGYVGVDPGTQKDKTVDYTINGFQTLPIGFPVIAKIGVAALEGDNQIDGDSFSIKANSKTTFTKLKDDVNPQNNFFNASISNGGLHNLERNPKSKNTMGFDIDHILLENDVNGVKNAVIPNGETGATLRLTTDGDGYGAFVTTFAVDVIEPKIVLTKIVKGVRKNATTGLREEYDLAGLPVTLGQEMIYEIGFNNQGNDNAKNFTITDILPQNVIFNKADDIIYKDTGIEFVSYTEATRTLIFKVSDDLVKKGGSKYKLQFRVRVVTDCNELVDACSNVIKNTAKSQYWGDINPNNNGLPYGDGSYSYNTGCIIGDPTSTNFLVGVEDCLFNREVSLCGSAILKAAKDYKTYEWKDSTGKIIGNTQQITVTKAGKYTVQTGGNPDCKGILQNYNVKDYAVGANDNPISTYADNKDPLTGRPYLCTNDKKEFPKIFLCGLSDTRFIDTKIAAADATVKWQVTTDVPPNGFPESCAYEDAKNWTTASPDGPTFTANKSGSYRVIVSYGNNCQNTFYFSVFQNPLKIEYEKRDEICNTAGRIKITNPQPGTGYTYSKDGTNFGDSNVFDNLPTGDYVIHVKQTAATTETSSCPFKVDVTILKAEFKTTVTPKDSFCAGNGGSIYASADGVRSDYHFIVKDAVTGELKGDSGVITFPNYKEFLGLAPGKYDVTVSTSDGCTETKTVTINDKTLTAKAKITKTLACGNGEITITASGGTPIPPATTPGRYYYNVNGVDIGTTGVIAVTRPLPANGEYKIKVTDYNSCSFTLETIKIEDVPKPVVKFKANNAKCYGQSNGSIDVTVTPATSGYTVSYSIDGGIKYSSVSPITNLKKGDYNIIVKYTYDAIDCFDPAVLVKISEPPTALTASAGVSELAGCGAAGEGRIRITNPQGGTEPYEYNFFNQDPTKWVTTNQEYKAPGTYTVYIRDAGGCVYPMPGIVIDQQPIPPEISVENPVTFNCDGTATSTVTVKNPGSANYSYNYYLDTSTTPNTNIPPNVFLNVPAGPHSVRIEYKVISVPTFSNLLKEDFGYGGDVESPGINTTYYCFERQVDATKCRGSIEINDGDYSVTAKIVQPFGAWVQPGDHTPPTNPVTPDGRCLVVNIGDKIPVTAVLYEKTIKDIIPGQPINFEFFAFNLLNKSNGQKDPNLTIALVNSAGVEISSFSTGSIPKSEKWEKYPKTAVSLDPGTNTTLRFILRSNVQETSGNDVAIDDITVYQLPKSCIKEVKRPFTVPTGKAFTSTAKTTKDVSCSGSGAVNDGEITITATNFDPATGYDYTIDGGVNWINNIKVSPFVIDKLGAKTYDLRIRYNATTGAACFTPFTPTIKAPKALIAGGSVILAAKCSVGATIRATGSEGTPAYEYELRKAVTGDVVRIFQKETDFKDVLAGDYEVFVRDANKCVSAVGSAVKVDPSPTLSAELDINSDYCFDNTDKASVIVKVSGGTGSFSYSIDGKTGQVSNEFKNIEVGDHTIIVTDAAGCSPIDPIKFTIEPELKVSPSVKALDCSSPTTKDAVITGNITGGYLPFTITKVSGPTGGTLGGPSPADTGRSFTYTTGVSGDYEFLITDKKGCTKTLKVKIDPITDPTIKETSKTNVSCKGKTDGAVVLTGEKGSGGYKFSDDGTTFTNDTGIFSGLAEGLHTFYVKDSKGCIGKLDVTITAPVALAGSATIAPQYTCDTKAIITATATDGNGDYTYVLKRGTTTVGSNKDGKFTDITIPGTYTVEITDGKGCPLTVSAGKIEALTPPTAMAFSHTALKCPSNKVNVTIESVTGGKGTMATFQYRIALPALSQTSFQGTTIFTDLAPDTYTFEVKDENNCIKQVEYTIDKLPEVSIKSTVDNTVICKGASNGTVTFTIGGFGNNTPYSYIIDGDATNILTGITGPTGTTFDITVSNLNTGNHTIEVTNGTTNCIVSRTQHVAEPVDTLALTPATVTPKTCADLGTATIHVTGGWNTNYTYTVTPPTGPAIVQENDNYFADLEDGLYNYTVKDLKGCEENGTFTIGGIVAINASIAAATNLCYKDAAKAAIYVTPNTHANYTYTLNGLTTQGNGTFIGLAPGKYKIRVTDTSTGCYIDLAEQTVATELTANTNLFAGPKCNTLDVVITGKVSGGTQGTTGNPLYTYTVTIDGNAESAATIHNVTTADGTFTYTDGSGIPAAKTTATVYVFTFTDAAGCTTTATRTVQPKTNPEIKLVEQVDEVYCSADLTGSFKITLDLNKGANPYVFKVVKTDVTPNVDFGSKITGLPKGDYLITVTDANGCTHSMVGKIKGPDPIVVDYTVVPITCDGSGGVSKGSIIINSVKGGAGNYTYHVTGYNYDKSEANNTGGTSFTFDIVEFGLYQIQITDQNNCLVEFKDQLVASQVKGLDIIVTSSPTICDAGPTGGGSANVKVGSALTGSGPFYFSIYKGTVNPFPSPEWIPETVPGIPSIPGPAIDGSKEANFTGLTPGVTYTFIVYDSGTKCYYFQTHNQAIPTNSTLETSALVSTNVSCIGNKDGNIKFTVKSNYSTSTNIKYEIFDKLTTESTGVEGVGVVPANGSVILTSPDLNFGNYYVLVKEEAGSPNAGCSVASAPFIIRESSTVLSVIARSDNNANCAAASGVVTAVGKGGTIVTVADPANGFPTAVPYLYRILPDTGIIGDISDDSQPNADTFLLASHTTNTFNVNAGSYIVYVRDAYGCIQHDFVTVDKDPEPEITAVLVDQCNTAEGKFGILVTLTNPGVGPYDYSLDGGDFERQAATTFTIPNVSSGEHTVRVKDANGCGNKVLNINIYAPLEIEGSFTTTPTCRNADGIITVDVKGGFTKPATDFEYTLVNNTTSVTSPVQVNNPVFINQAAGNYTVTVKDLNTGCTKDVTIDLVIPLDPDFSLANTAPNCSTPQGILDNGTITVTMGAINIDTPYKYTLTKISPTPVGSPHTQNTKLFTGLTAGIYEVTVTSSKTCPITKRTEILAPIPVTITLSQDDFKCTGTAFNNKIVTVTPGGGAGAIPMDIKDYKYSTNGTNWIDDNTFTVIDNGSPKTLTYYVKDAKGCIVSDQITIDPFPKLISVVADYGDLMDCLNKKQKMTVTITGGTNAPLPFTYQAYEDGVAIGNLETVTNRTFVFDALKEGATYKFEVFDNNTACSLMSISYNVPVFNKINVTANAYAMVDCNANTTGQIEINVVDYAGPYSYEILKGGISLTPPVTGVGDSATTSSFVLPDLLPAGIYTVFVKETAYPGCDFTTDPVTITEPDALTGFTVTNVPKNCNNAGSRVSIDLNSISGGSGGNTYAFVKRNDSPIGKYGPDSVAILDPATGTEWDVWVKDKNDCAIKLDVTIAEDLSPYDLAVNAFDPCPSPTGTYTFIVTATTVGGAEYSIGNGFQPTGTFTVDSSGEYTVTVSDKNGCTNELKVPILEELSLKVKAKKVSTCNNPDGEITVEAQGGSTDYEYSKDDVTYGPSPTFTLLLPNTYKLYVRDRVTGCKKMITEIIENATLITGFALTPTPVSCFGSSDGTITATMTTPSAGVNDNPKYMYSIDGGFTSQESNVFKDLAAGHYKITVLSGRGCPEEEETDVDSPLIIDVPAPAVVEFKCNTGTNAQNFATISVTGVTGGSTRYKNYEFIKVGTPNKVVYFGDESTYTVYDVEGGSYIVNVYDDKGCLGTAAAQVVVKPYIALDKVNVRVDNAITCKDFEDITVSVTSIGGTPARLEYSLVDETNGVRGAIYPLQTNTNGDFKGLPIADYIITVTNLDTGCSVESVHYVNNPQTFDLKIDNVVNVTCFAGNNGSANVTFIDRLITTTPVINPDHAGPFDYVVEDESGTEVLKSSSNNAGPVNIPNLAAGTYTVFATLKGSPFCTVSKSFTIDKPTAELAVSAQKQEITCADGNKDGKIIAFASGGWPGDYKYELRIGTSIIAPYDSSPNFENLIEGNYTVYVMDNKGCEASFNIPLANPTPISVAIGVDKTALLCYDNKDVTVTVNTITGGSGNYTFTLHGTAADGTEIFRAAQPTRIFAGLGAGTYYVTATDDWTCSNPSNTVVVSQPDVVKPSLAIDRTETCVITPRVTLTSIGGTPPYYYSTDGVTYNPTSFSSQVTIDLPKTTSTVSYKYFVRDTNGCLGGETGAIEFSPVPAIIFETLNHTDIQCKGDVKGSITAIAKGGLGNFVYVLTDVSGTPITPAPVQLSPGEFSELAVGNYRVSVKSLDCSLPSEIIEITEPVAPLVATLVPVNISCSGFNNGKITVNATGGTGRYVYAIAPNFEQFFDSNVFENLRAGIYTIRVQDENGCFQDYEQEITQPDPLEVTEVPGSMIPEYCVGDKDGYFEIKVEGGTGPYKYSLDVERGPFSQGEVGQTIFPFSELVGGKHTVYIIDANGCSNQVDVNMPKSVILKPTYEINYDCVNNSQSNMVIITVDPSNNLGDIDYTLDGVGLVQASNIFTNVSPGTHFVRVRHTNTCEDKTVSFDIKAYDPLTLAMSAGKPEMNIISVTAGGGAPSYEYSFNGEPFTSSNRYKIYKSGDYVVVVRDKNGCTVTITVPAIYIDVCLDNYFTPAGVTNTTWGPGCTNIYNNLEFSIFDRYGRVIVKYHYGQKWDGRYNGAELPSGDYWYVLKLNDPKDDREFVGHFTLYR